MSEPKPEHPYQMTISLNVLNHLGLNLYSSVPAVLGEAVANSYDADASRVDITVDAQASTITISDDGSGMDKDDINKKYLWIGYRKRENEPESTPKYHRDVMGRKGIGKLSLFSIAKVVEIQTVKITQDEKTKETKTTRNGFRMDVDEIKKAMVPQTKEADSQPKETDHNSEIKETNHTSETKNPDLQEANYHPDPIPIDQTLLKGTTIKLSSLKSTTVYETSLRRRLARRFTVIGEEKHFSVYVNGSPITLEDRGYFKVLEYLWNYGPAKYDSKCPKLKKSFSRSGDIGYENYSVTGWIGSVENSGDLREDKENLNKLLVLSRGKVVEEDMLDQFSEGGVYSKYVVAELDADFLDLSNKEDITTTSRQKIFEDDPRYQKLRTWLWGELKQIQSKWTDLRRETGEQKALESDTIKDWYEHLSKDNQSYAKKMFGKINAEAIGSDEKIRELFKYGVIAFQSLAYREKITELDNLHPNDLEAFATLFSELDEIEAVLYRQIVEERLRVIDALEKKVNADDLEKVIQKHLFDHLWLLDASWERATDAEPVMEKKMKNAFNAIDAKLSKSERASRLDIKYKVSSGKHIIIELKRAGRPLHNHEITKQVQKYNAAIEKLLAQSAKGDGTPPEPFEIVVVVGKPLVEWPESRKQDVAALKAYNARIVEYPQLIRGAQSGYKQYFEKKSKANEMLTLIKKLEDEKA
jgi:DNA mismatch repair ATPase MutL